MFSCGIAPESRCWLQGITVRILRKGVYREKTTMDFEHGRTVGSAGDPELREGGWEPDAEM
jgi:hypothetical protein